MDNKIFFGIVFLVIMVSLVAVLVAQHRPVRECTDETPRFCRSGCVYDEECKASCGCGCIHLKETCQSELECETLPDCKCENGYCAIANQTESG